MSAENVPFEEAVERLAKRESAGRCNPGSASLELDMVDGFDTKYTREWVHIPGHPFVRLSWTEDKGKGRTAEKEYRDYEDMAEIMRKLLEA